MPRDSFDVALDRARTVEKIVGAYLRRRGWLTLPVYDYCGLQENKAPRLEALNAARSLVTPDILGARGGKLRWFEVKSKGRAVAYGLANNELRTGFDLPHWRHYRDVQRETGVPVCIVFVHEHENEVRAAPIDELEPYVQVVDRQLKDFRRGAVFFPYNYVRRIATLSDVMSECSFADANETGDYA